MAQLGHVYEVSTLLEILASQLRRCVTTKRQNISTLLEILGLVCLVVVGF